jgi:hypothetical protein
MDVRPGQLIVFDAVDSYVIGRVDLVRQDTVTVFPWRDGDRRWERMRRRVKRNRLVSVLPEQTDPAPLADRFNALANQRDAERRMARTRFHRKIRKLLKEGDV